MNMSYDAIIIGAGQAGGPLAYNLADRGWKVALIEREHLGGSCINYGCSPTKKMVASAKAAYEARRAGEFGIHTGEVRVDLAKIVAMKDELVRSWRAGQEERVSSRPNITLFRGEAAFKAPYAVQVNQYALHSDLIFINTGTSAAVLDIPGIEDVPYLTNRTILALTEIPEHLVVIGGSYIGLEFGQMFRRFGSQVTIIERNAQIVPNEDSDISDSLQEILAAEGVNFILDARITQVEKTGQGGNRIHLRDAAGKEMVVEGTHLLLGIGRKPNTEALDLDAAGIAYSRGWILVNEHLETNQKGIYALGDVKGGPAFTHVSYNDFQIVYHNLFHQDKKSIRNRLRLYTLYTDPELGRVGMSEKEARQAGYNIKVGKVPMSSVARAVERNETRGMMKVVVDASSDRILGASMLSVNGGELVQTLMGLMLADAPWTLLKGAVFIHPTLTEGFFALMESIK